LKIDWDYKIVKVPITCPSIQQDDIHRVVQVLESGQLVQGDSVQTLETLIADYVGVEHAVAVSSGTATLHLALLALGVGHGDEVIIPAFSYVATANVVELVGAKPVFIDICLDSFNFDPKLLEDAITKRTRAIMPVHEFGFPADMGRVLALAKKYDIPVIEDAACALGSEWRGRKVGSIGNVGSFSLHPRKAVTSGEGGILTTNDSELASFFRVMRNHGLSIIDQKMECVAAGFNYRMTDIQASLVVGQIERISEIQEKRERIVARYDAELVDRWFIKPTMPKEGKTSWQSYHILLKDSVDRHRFFEYLKQQQIGANYGAQCIPSQRYYQNKYQYQASQFSNATRAFTKGVVLPLFNSMTDAQIIHVISAVNSFFRSENDKQ